MKPRSNGASKSFFEWMQLPNPKIYKLQFSLTCEITLGGKSLHTSSFLCCSPHTGRRCRVRWALGLDCFWWSLISQILNCMSCFFPWLAACPAGRWLGLTSGWQGAAVLRAGLVMGAGGILENGAHAHALPGAPWKACREPLLYLISKVL